MTPEKRKIVREKIDKLLKTDLKSGYHQIAIKENDKEKTAFITPEGLFHYTKMPFKRQEVKDLQSFLGLANYYRKFIENFAEIAKPLYLLLKKDAEFKWNLEQQEAFDLIKIKLTTAPVLALFDRKLETEVRTDASFIGLGAILLQKHEKYFKPVCYASRTLIDTETRYSATDLECTAVLFALRKFRQYLDGIQFNLITDHQVLGYLINNSKSLSAKHQRWVSQLQIYKFKIIHKKGKLNKDVDALSRYPQQTTQLIEEEFLFDDVEFTEDNVNKINKLENLAYNDDSDELISMESDEELYYIKRKNIRDINDLSEIEIEYLTNQDNIVMSIESEGDDSEDLAEKYPHCWTDSSDEQCEYHIGYRPPSCILHYINGPETDYYDSGNSSEWFSSSSNSSNSDKLNNSKISSNCSSSSSSSNFDDLNNSINSSSSDNYPEENICYPNKEDFKEEDSALATVQITTTNL